MRYERRVNKIEKYLTVSLPDSFCKELGMKEGDSVFISKTGGRIIIEKGRTNAKAQGTNEVQDK